MEIIIHYLSLMFDISVIAALILGTLVGLIFGVIPGLGVLLAMATLLPLSYAMPPLASIIMLLAAFQAAEYGGSITSILIGVPGTPQAAPTVIDGAPMARAGQPGKALGYSLTSSTIGGLLGWIALLVMSVPLARFALNLSDPEFFLLAMAGLLAVGALSTEDRLNSAISVVLGLMAGTVGMDLFNGVQRATFGVPSLIEGINMLALVIGAFALATFAELAEGDLNKKYNINRRNLSTHLTFQETKSILKASIGGAAVGLPVGILPGLGSNAASWFAYPVARWLSKTPEKFGHGSPEGIAGPESANNAVIGGALIPTLALGIPASAGMALVLVVFQIHGVQPGPDIMNSSPDLAYGLLIGFGLTIVATYIVGRYLTRVFALVVGVKSSMLIPILMLVCMGGAFTAGYAILDVWVMVAIGALFYILNKMDYSAPAFVLAFVLSPIIEKSLRRSLSLTDDGWLIFFQRPFSLAIVGLIVVIAVSVVITSRKRKLKDSSMPSVHAE